MSRNKEAVVFVLDAHPSMNTPYPAHQAENDGSTRLSCAKQALEGMVSQLMIQSKENEVGVLVINTNPIIKTEDGYEEPDDPHITSLALPTVTRPSVDLLQAIRRVECCAEKDYSGADVCRGMQVAEEALRHRTFKKKFRRRLVVFTDAAHRVESANNVILGLIDDLRELECTLTVIGVDFENSATFDAPLPKEEAAVKKEESGEEKTENHKDDDDDATMATADSDTTDNDSDDEEGSDDDDEEEEDLQNVKSQNEELLISVARLTGGSIVAATTMKEIAETTLGKRIPKSMKRKIEFQIGPGLSLQARSCLLLSKASMPSIKQDAVQLDENEKPRVDGNGDLMTNPIKKFTDHYNPDSLDEEVSESDRTKGFRYGADCIPMSSVDIEGLAVAYRSDPKIKILGYVAQSTFPQSFLIGPPYAITGHDSHRVCCAIAALAQALHQENKVAICINWKTNKADPVLGALYPLQEKDKEERTRLVFLQLPFADDRRPFNLPPLEASSPDSAESKACDELIDAMMLPSDAIQSSQIGNPAIRAFHKTVKERAVDPFSTDVVSTREVAEGSVDPMSTPPDILKGASAALETFTSTFPLEKVPEDESKGKKKKKYWTEE